MNLSRDAGCLVSREAFVSITERFAEERPCHCIRPQMQNAARERHFTDEWTTRSDAHAEIIGSLRTGIGVEVVGGAAIELVPAAQLVAQIDADSSHSHSHGEPADHAQSLTLA